MNNWSHLSQWSQWGKCGKWAKWFVQVHISSTLSRGLLTLYNHWNWQVWFATSCYHRGIAILHRWIFFRLLGRHEHTVYIYLYLMGFILYQKSILRECKMLLREFQFFLPLYLIQILKQIESRHQFSAPR